MSASAKSLRVERIKVDAARKYLDQYHPLGAGQAFAIALGVFLDARLAGVLTLGGPISNLAGRSLGLEQHELAELRKMHLSDRCPRNSESRVLAVAARLVRKNWPGVRALITYCDSEEQAAAYKAAGWRAGKTYRYAREVRVAGKWHSVRNANRHGVTKDATETRYESRTKWFLALSDNVAALV